MLGSIRKFSSSIFAKVFLFIVAIPFIFWGMGDVFTSGNQNTIVKIDNEKISTKDVVEYLDFYTKPDEELNEVLSKQKQAEEYNLAEIEVILENNFNDKKKIEEIKNQINEIGFKNAAIKYSSSSSALEGGNLGWINSQALSNMILSTVKEMNSGDISQPIFQSETVMFIKLLDKRKINSSDINVKKMKSQIISQKKNELLNLFSNTHLSKVKNSTLIQYNE